MTSTKNLIPLSRVVNAATIDTYEDKGKVQQIYTHHAARGLKKLDTEILKTGRRMPVLLLVNQNTLTATLPPDFEIDLFVGVINQQGLKIPLRRNEAIVNTKYLVDTTCVDACPKCNQDKAICADLAITQTTTIVVINGTNYEQTIVKRMNANGDFFLETSIPVLDVNTDSVIFRTSREFVASVSLLPCGCVDPSAANLSTIQTVCPDVYCQFFAPCGACDISYGGYEIFPESGLIQFDQNFKFSKVYLEYRGFMPKINGQYWVPMVAFETLVEWIKWKAIANKKNVSRLEKNDQYQHYITEKGNLNKILGRTSLAKILNSALTTPKFDIELDLYNPFCGTAPVVVSAPTDACMTTPNGTNTCSSGSTVITSGSGLMPFSLAVIAGNGGGSPIPGKEAYQLDQLKNAMNLTSIIVNDNMETIIKGDFTFDTLTGIIDRSPNTWFDGDVLVANYFKTLP